LPPSPPLTFAESLSKFTSPTIPPPATINDLPVKRDIPAGFMLTVDASRAMASSPAVAVPFEIILASGKYNPPASAEVETSAAAKDENTATTEFFLIILPVLTHQSSIGPASREAIIRHCYHHRYLSFRQQYNVLAPAIMEAVTVSPHTTARGWLFFKAFIVVIIRTGTRRVRWAVCASGKRFETEHCNDHGKLRWSSFRRKTVVEYRNYFTLSPPVHRSTSRKLVS